MSALQHLAEAALSMDVDPPQYQPYTLLRVKRKRNEEPMEGLGMQICIHEMFYGSLNEARC